MHCRDKHLLAKYSGVPKQRLYTACRSVCARLRAPHTREQFAVQIQADSERRPAHNAKIFIIDATGATPCHRICWSRTAGFHGAKHLPPPHCSHLRSTGIRSVCAFAMSRGCHSVASIGPMPPGGRRIPNLFEVGEPLRSDGGWFPVIAEMIASRAHSRFLDVAVRPGCRQRGGMW